MGLCRICLEEIDDNSRPRTKESIKSEVLQQTGIDFSRDPDDAPKKVHNKCWYQIKRDNFEGKIFDYNPVGGGGEENDGGEKDAGEEGMGGKEGGVGEEGGGGGVRDEK